MKSLGEADDGDARGHRHLLGGIVVAPSVLSLKSYGATMSFEELEWWLPSLILNLQQRYPSLDLNLQQRPPP
jgi:hypothetical protein